MPFMDFECPVCHEQCHKFVRPENTNKVQYCGVTCYKKAKENPKVGKMVICEVCGKQRPLRRSDSDEAEHRFCSNECYRQWMKENDGKRHFKEPVVHLCENCGKDVVYPPCHGHRNKHHFCSKECRYEWMSKQTGPLNKDYKRITVTCDMCGVKFDKKRNLVAKSKHNFCSNACRLAWDATSEEKKEQTRKNALKNLASYPRKTKPELMVDEYLKKHKHNFSSQAVINDRFCVDFLLPDVRSNGVVVEVLGDYFHARPDKYPDGPINKIQQHAVADDKRRKAYLTTCGYVVFGIWEGDIMHNASDAMKPVEKYLATGQLPLMSRFEHLQ